MIYLASALVVITLLFLSLRKRTSLSDTDYSDVASLSSDKKPALSSFEIGLKYERYIGYLFETKGYEVEFNGAKRKYSDMGRDLIVSKDGKVFIVQTKYWAKHKVVSEKHIFQLYGSLVHFRRKLSKKNESAQAIFCTTANYSHVALEAAQVLGIELGTEKFKKSYPQIKCVVTKNNYKIYLFPSDPKYDFVKVRPEDGGMYAYTVQEATSSGFLRPRSLRKVA